MESTENVAVEGTLTILFTDLEGSTDLRSRVGDDVATRHILEHEELIRSKLEEAGALEHKALGDGFMILFSSARQGIAAAVSIQREIEEYNRDHSDLPMKVRMGLNSGDVTQHQGDAYGTAVHAAARIAAKAQSGQILIPQIVRDLAGARPEFRVADRGLFWLKGFPDRWRLFEVLWRHKWDGSERSQARAAVPTETTVDLDLPRAQRPIVDRRAELDAVHAEVARAAAGALRAVVLEGEAGIGKTRVMEAAAEHASDSDPSFWALQVAADEELRGPFLLFRTLLGDPRVAAIAREAMALEPLERARAAIGGRPNSPTGLLERFEIDDVVGAVPVHLAAGIWGTLAVAVFGNPEAWGGDGRLSQLGVQATGVFAGFVWAFGLGFLLLWLINRKFPLRVDPDGERVGLNVAEHGASTEILDLLTDMDKQRQTDDCSTPIPVEPHTEIGQIARQYNRVLDGINAHTTALQLLRNTASAANDAESVEEAIRTTVREVCTATGWPVGHAYVVDGAESTLLVPTGIWQVADPDRYARSGRDRQDGFPPR